MTRKLFYEDSYLTNFEGTVLACEPYKEGYAVILDQTAFYPEGGGQPADIGLLGENEVAHVFIKDETIYHVMSKPLKVGEKVKGIIDFERRFDYMQQHSGEHIVSGLIKSLYGYNNVGFHLSTDYMTADFDGELTKEAILEVERLSNNAIFQNIPVVGKHYDKEEIQNIDYRSKIDIIGQVRLVTIEGYDSCACCGTHVRHTGEIGIIKCIKNERHRGGTRLTLLCGRRALKDYAEKQEIVTLASGILSAKPEAIIQGIYKQQEEIADYKERLIALTKELFEFKAKEYAKGTEPILCIHEEGLKGDEIRRLCSTLMGYTDKMCLVLATEEGKGFKYTLGCKQQDVRALAKALNEKFSGRGGGPAELCQGSINGELEDIRAFLNDFYKE